MSRYCPFEPTRINKIISGKASGADALGARYANYFGIELVEFPAKWDDLTTKPCIIREKNGRKYNALAGTNRNKLIVNNSDFIIAFWDGKSTGTKNSIKYAREKKKPTLIIYV